MSIENSHIVDLIGIDKISGECVLTISDHLEWGGENNHIPLLQGKLNKYLSFIESGEILHSYPDTKGRKVRIDLAMKYEPEAEHYKLLAKIKADIEAAGFGFKADIIPD